MSQIPDWVYSSLCHYDLRNPEGVVLYLELYEDEEIKAFGPHTKPDCFCDSCHWGRARLANYIIDNVKPN